ncbi:hypothetical protein B0H10DRAFT_2245928 [Mycena sp. CBHHK59/15]|nr:hypothetical protein B0H10DRAFT_2245928 [Mycena sp. CBHHK59/15]
MSSGEQCAVGSDGNLLPADQIVFYNDPDDANPLPPIPASTSTPGAGQAVPIPNLFCRSARTRTVSSRLTDPNNVEAPKLKAAEDLDSDGASAGIRKSSLSPSRTDEVLEDEDIEMPGLQPVSNSEDDRDDDNDEADPATDTEDGTPRPSEMPTERCTIPFTDLTKDIHPLFKEGEMLDPDTGKDVDNVVGWWGHHSAQYPTPARMARDYLVALRLHPRGLSPMETYVAGSPENTESGLV